MQRLNLVDRSNEMGAYSEKNCTPSRPNILPSAKVRGIGLFWAVELVKDQQTKEPFNIWQDKLDGKPMVVDQIAAKMTAQGVLVMSWMSHFLLAPPLIVTKAEIDELSQRSTVLSCWRCSA